ncbi:DUF4202 domain-containing protein [Nibricoccus sp. IMCC34717]|uniref:DUF4202 domain-containing protein n=1 Tax=Nibricoccus sp. IMCC34717 TaxID=3034021 RepID=UPI0038503CF7
MDAYTRAIVAIDTLHAADPARTPEGRPAELVYAERMEAWIIRLDPEATPLLRLAAHCQHLERWLTPRASFPEGRAGYLQWRRSLYTKQAERAQQVLLASGISPTDAAEVYTWVSKDGLKTNAGTQALEDAACLVFLAHEIEGFAAQHSDYSEEKYLEIIRKTWRKMSPRAHELALAIPFSGPVKALVTKALSAS